MTTRMRSSSNLILHHALPWLLLVLLLSPNNATSSEAEERETYIIHMDHSQKPASFSTHEAWHRDTLQSLSSSSPTEDKEMLIYSYSHVMHGFSARLTPSQLSEIEKSPAHIATYKESFGKLFTTRTTKFLGLKRNSGIWPAASFGKDVIIGIIDTGIWPESESFSDKGMSPVPKRWKGKCENGTEFSPSACNRKLIGARYFNRGLLAAGLKVDPEVDFNSARDFYGHGTHTSSTAAGNNVLGVSHFGYARGTARGVAPGAHVAMYKVLWSSDFANRPLAATDVLAGMDQAVADGVDIMSLSIAFPRTPYFKDVIAIASLSAIEKGIFVAGAAGNDGPSSSTTYNGAPWIMTVGAGTIDRSFAATMTLGNGLTVEGESYFPDKIRISSTPLYYGRDNESKAICNSTALDPTEVAGSVVLCDSNTDIYRQMVEVKRAGAFAAIFLNDKFRLDHDKYEIPSMVLHTHSGTSVRKYVIREASNATVKSMRFVLTKLGTKPAPQVANFSSRGPDLISPGVLKPDIIAPGEDVVASISPIIGYVEVGNYNLGTDFALYSGTSMSTPHVAGVAALLKAVHRDWSPAAIRSAIMTTAYTIDNTHKTFKDRGTGLPTTPLDFGAGHINPDKAMEPGLIYDMNLQDYVQFLCGLGYTKKQMSAVIRQSKWSCSEERNELNYPSFVGIFTRGAGFPMVMNFSRVLTNVGDDGTAIYQAFLEVPAKMRIRTEPSTLTFTRKYQKQSFVLSVEIDKDAKNVTYGFLKWIDQHGHIVSSPIVAISN